MKMHAVAYEMNIICTILWNRDPDDCFSMIHLAGDDMAQWNVNIHVAIEGQCQGKKITVTEFL
jgi:hypothetical protein